MEAICKSENDGILCFDTPESLFKWNGVGNITSNRQQSTYKLNNFNWNKAAKRPRTLVCHDHRGGTFIIESVALFNQCFSDDSITDKIVSSLVDLCKNMNFDGWLINIENAVDSVYLDRLEGFLRKLRRGLRDNVHNCTQVIWYDSVVNSGELCWQNELNKDNKRWFSAVDGFYTNYGWTECHLETTLETFYKNFSDDKSLFDIYIGIDVFGRDCTGGWECFKPLEVIRRYNFSAAIFAPGWICETCPKRDQKISLFDNSESLFLCNILIEQTDRYLKMSYKSSFPVEFVIEVSNSLNVEHLLAKTKKSEDQPENVQGITKKFSSLFNNQNTEGEEQKQIDEEYFPIENHWELNLQQKSVLFEESLNNGGNAGGVGSSVSAYEENFGGTTIKRHKALGKNTNLSPYSSGSAAQFPINERLQTFVHTFETLEQCAISCPRPCAMTVMEELEMMQRWICDPNARVWEF
uniref:Mannosyl-glycoprotein endo-beta-N-acetylglucosaminidase n=1 Tax=Meloidogyne javanica TaxID=6303 RepID=A0A915MGI0_MELJA